MRKLQKAYSFDDVLVKPIPSVISSRDDVDISIELPNKTTLSFPILASPMVGVVDGCFAKKLSDMGGLAIFHRFYKNNKERYEDIASHVNSKDDMFGIALRIGDNFLHDAIRLSPQILLIDTANGYTKKLLAYCKAVKTEIHMKNKGKEILLMAGNVATGDGAINLFECGCDLVRIGIGGGSPCSTSNMTGVGIPYISALMDCYDALETYKKEVMLVVDGGLRHSGDFVKAVVAGADLGIAGKLYAECYESPNEGVLYGMASRTHMENSKIKIKSVEGFDTKIDKKHSLEQFVREFGYGIKSAGTYLNANSLESIWLNGEFVEVSDHAIKKNI